MICPSSEIIYQLIWPIYPCVSILFPGMSTVCTWGTRGNFFQYMVIFCSVSACAVVLLCAICGHFHTIVPTLILRFFLMTAQLRAYLAPTICHSCMRTCTISHNHLRRQYNLPPLLHTIEFIGAITLAITTIEFIPPLYPMNSYHFSKI